MSLLRDYQERLLAESSRALHAHAAVVTQLGTGGGKSHIAITAIARRLAAKPASRIVFAAPLDAIVSDAAGRARAAGLHVGIVQAGRPSDPTAPVQVCSQQTLAARDALPPADFVILDECHHACASTVRDVLARFRGARIWGLTATPQRGDGQALDTAGFAALVCGPDNAWLTAHGYLVPMDVVAPVAPLRGLACSTLEAVRRWGDGRRTIVFCRSIAQAERDATALQAAGVAAVALHGQSPAALRSRVRDALTTGALQVACTVGVAREGWDCPPVEVALFACKVGVAGTWLQMLGRVSRPSPATGKRRALAIDLAGSWVELGLRDDPRQWSLTGAAVRAAAQLAPMTRCGDCGAVFPPATRCPRCGALRTVHAQVQRILSRADKLALVSALPRAEQDRRYLDSLRRVAAGRMKLAGDAAERAARRMFRERRGRDPEVAA